MPEAPPPFVPRDSGDAWVEGPDGRRFWGRYGAAGLLVHDESAGVLLQHRAEWSHFGGTWGLPGGARHEGESAVDGAIREAGEEAGVPAEALQIAFTSVLDLGYWSYVTVVTRAAVPFEPEIGDAESLELRWVPVDEVEALPLHPGFGSAWPELRARLSERVRIIVDAANVVGSRPDGWWRDRAGAAEKLLARVDRLSAVGVDAADFGGPPGRVWPSYRVVVEGKAREAEAPDAAQPAGAADVEVPLDSAAIVVVRAHGSGDDAIAEEAATEFGGTTVVVTADRELSGRVEAVGAEVRGPGWFLGLLDGASAGAAVDDDGL
ncbi:NUDIX domain-containing protein [Herbiconiux solani]|uniref:NUDIX domain-containing protein n=1 Tax=Herbiconiux solani TaxID=661329 RepID=UPI000825FF14|nr:NUDIX hydrolase [Herbiconiux solani]